MSHARLALAALLVAGAAHAAPGGKLYWINNGFSNDAVRRANLDGTNGEVVVGGLNFPQDVAVDGVRGKVYWTNNSNVHRANLDGTGIETINTSFGTTRGVAVDELGAKVYWTVFGSFPAIRRMNLDGTGLETLVTAGLNVPSHLAVDHAGGKLYWVDQNDQQVQRSNLDGSDVEDLHANGGYGLALDLVEQKLYWGFVGTIFRSNLDGSGVELFATTPGTVQGMALDAEARWLYFAGLNPARVQRLHLDTLHPEYLILGTDTPLGVDLDLGEVLEPVSYCTAGTSASGCTAQLAATGTPSASATSGFVVTATGVEGAKDGLFFFGANGRQANTWGSGTSLQCVVPPVLRAGLLPGTGTSGACDGVLAQDLTARWTAKPAQNPGAGALVQVQLWYRDPLNTSNQTTSLSDALELELLP